MKKILQYLQKNFDQADEAVNHLVISIIRCKSFINNKKLSEEQLIELEALTGRFARASDLLIQKVLKTIERLDGSAPGTVRDRILQAEKKGLTTDAKILLIIRDVRNTIAHEYEFQNQKEIFVFAFNHTSFLIDVLANAKQYSQKFYLT